MKAPRIITASQQFDDNERHTPLAVLRALQHPKLPPLPPVTDREFWRHDLASGQYWGLNGDWVTKRAPRGYTHARINSVRQLKETLRAGMYAWPGGYPMYFITEDGGTLHFECVKENYREVVEAIRDNYSDGWKVVACEINEEKHDLYCDQCSDRIEAGTEPDDDEQAPQ